MKRLPSREEILHLLDRLDEVAAGELESDVLDFKPWLDDAKENMNVAVEMSVCFANAEGGVVVFGVRDRVRGRSQAITGCSRYDLDTWRGAIYDTTRPHLTVEIEETEVPEGTLLYVRVPKGPAPPYGTAAGLYKIRVGKSCMPLDPDTFQRRQVAVGAIDWSAQTAEGVRVQDLNQVEIARLHNVIEANRPGSPLLKLSNEELLQAVGAMKEGRVTRAGLLVLGRQSILSLHVPQHEVIYLHYASPTDLDQRLDLKAPLLCVLERLTDAISIRNSFRTLKTGLFHIDIPAYPEEVFREAILNALIHRDYLEPGSVYIRHSKREMVISNPGGFIGGIAPENILHHEPKARNRLLAEMFQKVGLVERAGIGRLRIFIPTLAYGKRMPRYEADEHTVVLTVFNSSYDESLATFIATRQRAGVEFDLDELLLLSYLREHAETDTSTAAKLCQRSETVIRDVMERLVLQPNPWLERRGKKRGVTYHLNREAAAELIGKAAYTKVRGIDAVRYPELIRTYVEQHGSISNRECRELLGFGDSPYALTKTSRLLSSLNFLKRYGTSPKTTRYRLREENDE